MYKEVPYRYHIRSTPILPKLYAKKGLPDRTSSYFEQQMHIHCDCLQPPVSPMQAYGWHSTVRRDLCSLQGSSSVRPCMGQELGKPAVQGGYQCQRVNLLVPLTAASMPMETNC